MQQQEMPRNKCLVYETTPKSIRKYIYSYTIHTLLLYVCGIMFALQKSQRGNTL